MQCQLQPDDLEAKKGEKGAGGGGKTTAMDFHKNAPFGTALMALSCFLLLSGVKAEDDDDLVMIICFFKSNFPRILLHDLEFPIRAKL